MINATLKAVLVLALMPKTSFSARDSEIAGTRLIVIAAVKIVAKLINGTAIPVR